MIDLEIFFEEFVKFSTKKRVSDFDTPITESEIYKFLCCKLPVLDNNPIWELVVQNTAKALYDSVYLKVSAPYLHYKEIKDFMEDASIDLKSCRLIANELRLYYFDDEQLHQLKHLIVTNLISRYNAYFDVLSGILLQLSQSEWSKILDFENIPESLQATYSHEEYEESLQNVIKANLIGYNDLNKL